MKQALVLCCFLNIYTTYAATVEGFVINARGDKIASALVEIVDPYKPEAGVLHYVRADSTGFFKEDGLSIGYYMIFASNENEDYGNTELAVFSDSLRVPEVKIVDRDQVVDVKVDLGTPGAVITALVEDQGTGLPISSATVRILLEGRADKYISTRTGEHGSVELLVPSRAITIASNAPGYRTRSMSLTLSPSEHKSLTVSLTKESNK